MKIAIVGCGAVGSYYGALLSRAGSEVHFLLRSDYDAVRRQGVSIRSPQGDFHVQPKCARAPEEVGPSDAVLVALKSTANSEFSRLIPPLVGPRTMVVTLQNGLGNEAELARFFPPEQILGGLCFVCLNRIAPGVIQHMAHGKVVLGEYLRWPEPRTHDFATLLRNAGVPCVVTENLERAHWEKLVWNIPFNGLGVAGVAGFEAVTSGKLAPNQPLGECLTTDKLLADPKWTSLVRELMMEVIHGARALGYDLEESHADHQIERTRTMGAYKASTLIDYERGLALELQTLFLEPLRQAQQAGQPMPRLGALCQVLESLPRSSST
jgi:2-dehydropantoate 2-reductase